MKKLTLFLGALMIAGAAFACDGGKSKKACCKKEEKTACCSKKDSKDCKSKESAKKEEKTTQKKS
ncbi:MAG TPA: hypothetical protein PLQ78_07765 [Flavipsychrobacter sp.]|jgi:hypothetical protein|nr:hypothetical protein [Flavipsychrobacter sp.]